MSAGCAGPLSTLAPEGPAASAIATLWWAMLIGAALITVLVLGLVAYGWSRRHEARQISQQRWIVGGGLVFPVATLFVLLLFGLWVGERLTPHPTPRGLVTVEAHGHQWWWEFVYHDAEGRPLYGASELHIPAGRPIDVRVGAGDVIHSFWVPRLAGKMDGIPGHINLLRIEAPAPGRYRGQCAEYCGIGHARNVFSVQAHEPDAYDAWVARLAASRPPAGNPDFARACGACHAVDPRIRGRAPNLAASAGRHWPPGHPLAAPDPEDRRHWLRTHGGTEISDAELDRLLPYLGSLR